MPEAGLLGVGNGVTTPKWLGRQEPEIEGTQRAPREQGVTEARDRRITSAAVLELGASVTRYSQSIDLAAVNANSLSSQNFTVTETDLVDLGDYIFASADLGYGLVVDNGPIPAPANDTVTIRLQNVTAGSLNAGATTFYFVIIKPTSIV